MVMRIEECLCRDIELKAIARLDFTGYLSIFPLNSESFCETSSVMLPACFQGHDRMNVLASYVLHVFQVFDGVDHATRIKIRQTFNLFAHGFMTSGNFQRAASLFGTTAENAAKKLIEVRISPGTVVTKATSRNWSAEETMLLLARFGSRGEFNHESCLLHGRPSRDSLSIRVKRAIADLDAHQMLTDERCAPTLTLTHCSVASIPPADGRKGNSKFTNKIMKLSRSFDQAKRELQTKDARHQKELAALVRKMSDVSDMTEVEDEACPENVDYSRTLLAECGSLLSLSRYGRRYSQFMYEISELIRATSRKTYRIIRQLFLLPSEAALFAKYGSIVKSKKKELTDANLLGIRIQRLLGNNGVLRNTPITIAIDAFSFRTFTGRTIAGEKTTEKYSNAFLFLLIPLDFSLPVQVLHLQKKANGAYDESIQKLFERIKREFVSNLGSIWFKATDGDRYLSKEHDLFFQEHVAAHRNDYMFLLDDLHTKLCNGLTIPIADPLHFAKNIRGKILDHNVAVVDSEYVILLVNKNDLQAVLNVKDALDDASLLGRMRDVYVTKLFTLENVCTLIEKKMYAGAFLFLPYAAVFTVSYATNLSLSSRVFFAKLAYLAFERLLLEAEKLTAQNKTIKYRYCSGCLAVTVAEPTYLKRMMHSCLALGISMLFGPTNLRLDALGTHLVENAIGVSRSIANSTKYETISSAFATAELRKEISRKYDITLYLPKRVNDGGAKINTLGDGIEHPEDWDANDIVSRLAEACDLDLLPSCEDEVSDFAHDLREFLSLMDRRELFETSEVANALIVQRNYKFKSEPEKEDENKD